jgi:RNA polymerase sigma-70 factor, ECF subfamily
MDAYPLCSGETEAVAYASPRLRLHARLLSRQWRPDPMGDSSVGFDDGEVSAHSPHCTPAVGVGDASDWASVLRGPPTPARDDALARLHPLLLRAARFELVRRREQLRDVGAAELDDLAYRAADHALMAILDRLDEFRGTSRFTTWASKFALLEAGLKGRRRAWQDHELSLNPEGWYQIGAGGPSARVVLEDREALAALCESVRSSLTPHQREVFTALALNGIPIDVLAARRGTTRGALYKTLHDARRKLRVALMDAVP